MNQAAQFFAERARSGTVILDGAMGMLLEQRGVPMPAPLWSAAVLHDSPEIVAGVHREYVLAGADVLVANTFRTNPRTMLAAGQLEHGEDLTRLAVQLAREATREAGRPIAVAASVAPVEDCYRPEMTPPFKTLMREHEHMMEWVAASGADLVWIETINTVREAFAAASCAVAAGLPLVVSFYLNERGELASGEHLEEALAAVEVAEPLAIGVNCIPPSGITHVASRLRRLTPVPLAAYGHLGTAELPGWKRHELLSPAEYAEVAQRWRSEGVSVLGGCCGTTPEHIAELARRFSV